jgi:hypothetical protein
VISVDIEDSDRLTRHLAEQIAGVKKRGLLSAAGRLVQVIQTELIPHENPPPVDQAIYKDAWDFQETAEGAAVFNTAPHAAVIEYGARAENIKPGRAMVRALSEWVVRKGLVPKTGNIQDQAGEKGALSVAWAIITSMKRRGIFNRDREGLRIAEKAAARAPALIAEEIRAELRELR